MSSEQRRRKSNRSRKRTERLEERDIVAAALALIETDGVAALSMRALAQRLGVTPMATYYHVPNKEALLERVAESLLAQVATPTPSPAHWQSQLREYAISVWQILSPYPGLSRFVLERPPMKSFERVNNFVLAALRAGGYEPRRALLAMLGFHTFVGGVVSAQSRRHRPGRKRATRAAQPPSMPPEARRFFEQVKDIDPREWLEFGLDTMLAGLALRARGPSTHDGAQRGHGTPS